jgi:hypothetical protein
MGKAHLTSQTNLRHIVQHCRPGIALPPALAWALFMQAGVGDMSDAIDP